MSSSPDLVAIGVPYWRQKHGEDRVLPPRSPPDSGSFHKSICPLDHLPGSSHKNRTNNGNLADATDSFGTPTAIPAFPPTR